MNFSLSTQSHSVGAKELFESAQRCHDKGELDRALAFYGKTLKIDENHWGALYGSALICAQTKHFEESLVFFERAHALNPNELNVLLQWGGTLKEMGRLESALEMFDRALQLNPTVDEIYIQKGLTLMGLKSWRAALTCFLQVIPSQPQNASLHLYKARALSELKEFDGAMVSFDQAISLDDQYIEAYFSKAQSCLQAQDLSLALASLDRVVQKAPNFAVAHQYRGYVLFNLARLQEAIEAYQHSLSLQPSNKETWFQLGVAQQRLEQFDAALNSFEKAIQLGTQDEKAFFNAGLLLINLGRYSQAIKRFNQVIDLGGEAPLAYVNRGMAQQFMGDLAGAQLSFNQAIAIDFQCALAHFNLGVLQQKQRDLQSALMSYGQTIKCDPEHLMGWLNMGDVLHDLQHPKAAIECYERALILKPDDPRIIYHMSLSLLLDGQYERGWEYFESRRDYEGASLAHRKNNLTCPLWRGQESIENRIILIQSEQGLGDTLQFVRFVQALLQARARVVLEVPAALKTLLRCVPGVELLIAQGERVPEVDFYCPMMSLPYALRRHLENELDPFIAQAPYIKAPAAKLKWWSERMNSGLKRKVGLVWSGGFRPNLPSSWEVNERRNIPLGLFEVLNLDSIEFYSLQKGEPAQSELAQLSQSHQLPLPLINWMDDAHDFSDTAALVEQLDLVISVDTSTAHLAAAMGKPVWLLNRYDTCWRWGVSGSQTVWYPTMRLFRQTQLGDWRGVMQELRLALEQWLRTH
jgi:tetratricopeptide (TPR) repeat protein